MKSNLIFSSLLSVSFLFVSCKKEEEAAVTSDDKPKEIIMPRVQSIPVQANNQQVQNATPLQSQQPVTNGQPVTLQSAPQPVATKPGMNPPHGQPGHRCDIAVGAPLSSPPGTGQAVTSTPVTAPSGNTKMPTAESKTVNEKVIFQPEPVTGSSPSLSGSPVTARSIRDL